MGWRHPVAGSRLVTVGLPLALWDENSWLLLMLFLTIPTADMPKRAIGQHHLA